MFKGNAPSAGDISLLTGRRTTTIGRESSQNRSHIGDLLFITEDDPRYALVLTPLASRRHPRPLALLLGAEFIVYTRFV